MSEDGEIRITLPGGKLLRPTLEDAEPTDGARVALELANQLTPVLGSIGQWVFLVGFWGAVFSSLLGVWQSVPYLFADFFLLTRGNAARARGDVDFARTVPYRVYLVLIAIVPLPLLWWSVERAQLSYAVLASLFMPLLAVTLLLVLTPLVPLVIWIGLPETSQRELEEI